MPDNSEQKDSSVDRRTGFLPEVPPVPSFVSGKADASEYRKFLKEKGKAYSRFVLFGYAAKAGMIGGVIAVVGCFLQDRVSSIQSLLFLIFFTPFLEEILKQSGMLWILEKRPWMIRYSSEFFIAGAMGGLTFGILENLIYSYFYLCSLPEDGRMILLTFRWIICTTLHIFCTLVSSMGLHRAWRIQITSGKYFDLRNALGYFTLAIAIHGIYNFCALTAFDRFIKG